MVGHLRKVQVRTQDAGLILSTGLCNRMTLDTPRSDKEDDGREGSLETSDYGLSTKMTNVPANTKVLKSAIEQLSSKQGKNVGELGELVKTLSSQIHDVSIRLGDNPGFVRSSHNSAWNGITVVQGNLEAERKFDKHLSLMVDDRVKGIMKEQFHILARMNGYMQGLIAEEVSRINCANEDANNLTNLFIKDLQDKI
jgi:hypothetical protein